MEPERDLAVEQFERLSESYRLLADLDPTLPRCGEQGNNDRRAGLLVIAAFRRGWLPEIGGLPELVAWAEGPEPHDSGQAVFVPCPSNLFVRFCGNDEIPVRLIGDHKAEAIGDTCGGILPAQYAGLLPGHPHYLDGRPELAWREHNEQRAIVCRWLAGVIGVAADPPGNAPEWPNQAAVVAGLGKRRDEVSRLVKAGRLRSNGKRGRECRIDPASILEYCRSEGIAWNER